MSGERTRLACGRGRPRHRELSVLQIARSTSYEGCEFRTANRYTKWKSGVGDFADQGISGDDRAARGCRGCRVVEEGAEEAAPLSATEGLSRRSQSACLRFFLNAVLKEICAGYPNLFTSEFVRAINGLSKNPRPPGCRKLSGGKNDWRIRVGDYRVIYEIADADQIVRVNRVRHRRAAYR